MFSLDDTKIKRKILEYQEKGTGYIEILEEVSTYIYNFPRIIFAQIEEECTDFYLYFLNRFPKLLLKYKVQKTKFLTWLTLVLRRQYINWQKQQTREKNKSVVQKYINFESILGSEDFDYCFFGKKEEQSSVQSFLQEAIISVFNSLPAKVRITMKIHYFDFFEGEDLKEVSKLFHQNSIELLGKYIKLFEISQAQYEKERKLQISLNECFHKYQIINQKLKDFSNELSLVQFSEQLENCISQTKKQRDACYKSIQKYRAELKKFYVQIKPKDIAEFLNISPNAVHHLLHRGKNSIQEKLKEKLKGYFPEEFFQKKSSQKVKVQ